MTRTKVCHIQPMCQTRARTEASEKIIINNVVDTIRFKVAEINIPRHYINQLKQVLADLSDKRNVKLVFVGHTDNQLLGAWVKEKYGDNLGLSRARAKRVAEYFRSELGLSVDAIKTDGFGFSRPVASNESLRGRSLNR